MKKIFNMILVILMSIIIIFNISNVSIASISDLVSGAQSESGPKPPPPTPSDDSGGGTFTPSLVQEHGDITIAEPYYTGVTGNAYEDLGIKSGTAGKDSSGIDTKAIKDIKVELYNESDDLINGSPLRTVYTNDDGYYEFKNVSPGNYKVKFTYGLINNKYLPYWDSIPYSQKAVNVFKNSVKYNGQDYLVESLGGRGSTSYVAQTYSIDRIIKTCGAGCAQIFLAIDCSTSMRNSKVEINGVQKTMLQAEIDAAKEMIESLLDGKKNIYIGIVAFSGTCYRAVSLTDNASVLEKALDEINDNNWYTPNTDVNAAIQKAYTSFSNNTENSNRYIMVLTDGIPTKFGNTEVYYDESEDDTYNKLIEIGKNTRNAIKDYVENKGVNIYGVCISNDNDTEDGFVKNIFDGTCSEFYLEKDIKTILYKINGNFKKYILENIQTNESGTEMGEDTYSLYGEENQERRKELNDLYSELYYNNTEYFRAIDMDVNVNNWNEFKEKVKKICENAYMIAISDTYKMTPKGQNYDVTRTDYYEENDNGNVKKVSYEYTEHHVFIETIYENQNIVLNNRGYFNLVPNMTATGLRVTASNLQVLKTVEMEDKTISLMAELDPTLIYGSRVDIEYTVEVNNYSSIPCKSLSMIVYLPKGFSYNNKLSYVTGKPEEPKYTVKSVNKEELKANGLVSADFSYNDLAVIESKEGFYIKPGEKAVMKFMISKLISTDVEDSTYDAMTEVLKYSNNSGRRMQYLSASKNKFLGEFPGNANTEETDFASSTNLVKVIPPTGTKENVAYLYLTIVVLIIALLNVSRLKNKVKRNRNK